jgi:hypothetical protein
LFLQFGHSEAIKVECGSVWSEWSDPDSNGCGDRFRYRTKLDDFGIAEKETQNIGYIIYNFLGHSNYDLVKNVNSADYQTNPNCVIFIKQVVTAE